MITDTARGDILHGAPDRERLTVVWCCFNLRIIAPIVVVCFSTKLLANGFVALSRLVQVYNLISYVLGQLFGLAHGGEDILRPGANYQDETPISPRRTS